MTLDELKASAFVVGLKETERAIDRGEAGHVFIASDCDDRISLPLRNVCAKAGISVTDDFTKKKSAEPAVSRSKPHPPPYLHPGNICGERQSCQRTDPFPRDNISAD